MKKYLPFFIIFLLISAIPGAIFFLFPNAASNINSGDIPANAPVIVNGLSAPLEQQASHYLLRLQATNPPLKQGRQTLRLEILNRDSGSPWAGLPQLQVKMPMGDQMMDAPVQVKPLPDAGVYQLETTFSMPGGWELWLQLKNPDEAIKLAFDVQAT